MFSLDNKSFNKNDVGSFLLFVVSLSQFAITLSVLISFVYGDIIKRGEMRFLNTFSQEVKPIQLLVGSILLIWWIRSNNWNEKTLAVTPSMRMILFQYALICIYISFDLMITYWKDPEIDKS